MERVEKEMKIQHSNYSKVKDIIKNKLFPSLRDKGFIARMNFSCCSTCASYELSQVAKIQEKDQIVFYHNQDAKIFRERGYVYLRFFSMNDKSVSDIKVGQIISETAKECGLIVEWDGSEWKCITVKV